MSRPLRKRAVVRLAPTEAGEDVTGFLQGLVTNDVKGATRETPVYAAMLTAQGKTLFDFLIWAGEFPNGPGFYLDCEKQVAEELVQRLSLYRLRRKIDIAIENNLGAGWDPEPGNDPRLRALGTRCLMAPHLLEGAPADADYRAHRLALGVPEGREEMGDILWLETNATDLNGVSFSKGCYVGQENTARMNWRGKVNRRLMVLPLEVSNPKRRRVAYPDLELAVDHLRIDDIPRNVLPSWARLPDPKIGEETDQDS